MIARGNQNPESQINRMSPERALCQLLEKKHM